MDDAVAVAAGDAAALATAEGDLEILFGVVLRDGGDVGEVRVDERPLVIVAQDKIARGEGRLGREGAVCAAAAGLRAAAGGRGGERALVVADHIEHALLLGADGEEVRGVERDAQHEHHARDGERGDADEPLAQTFNHGCFPVRTRARGWRGWSRSSRCP